MGWVVKCGACKENDSILTAQESGNPEKFLCADCFDKRYSHILETLQFELNGKITLRTVSRHCKDRDNIAP